MDEGIVYDNDIIIHVLKIMGCGAPDLIYCP
jgi:hypothetical protein